MEEVKPLNPSFMNYLLYHLKGYGLSEVRKTPYGSFYNWLNNMRELINEMDPGGQNEAWQKITNTHKEFRLCQQSL